MRRTWCDDADSACVLPTSQVFVCRLLHEIHLGMVLTEEEAADFCSLQWAIMKMMALPQSAADSSFVRSTLGAEESLARKV